MLIWTPELASQGIEPMALHPQKLGTAAKQYQLVLGPQGCSEERPHGAGTQTSEERGCSLAGSVMVLILKT